MGGRGTFASGNPVPYTYNTVGKIEGVKVLQGVEHYPAFPGYYPTYEKHLKGILSSNISFGNLKS